MKVLLCEDIQKLGWLGDIVEVNTGYARNYLLPQGLAKVATEGNIRALAKEKAKRAEHRLQQRRRMEKAVEAVNGAEAVLAARANEQGVLFGSITEALTPPTWCPGLASPTIVGCPSISNNSARTT
jgi:large subunit ribosomal protein L9